MQPTTTHASPALSARLRAHVVVVWLVIVLSAWSAMQVLDLRFEIVERCSDSQRFSSGRARRC